MNFKEFLNNFTIEYEGKKIDLDKIEIYKKPFKQNSIICKYAIRYWDDKDNSEKKEIPNDFLVMCYDKDGTNEHYLSFFDKDNKFYKFGINIDEAIVFPSRATALKVYQVIKKIKDNDSNTWISHCDVLTVARKSEVLKWNNIFFKRNEGGNYVLAYFDSDNKLKYIKSLWNKSCWTVEDIEEAKRFTKIGAVQALEKILQINMVNFKHFEIEPFIVSLTKKEEE